MRTRTILPALLLAGLAACRSEPAKPATVTDDNKVATDDTKVATVTNDTKVVTATNLENVDPSDTVEDPTYAAMGEELAKENAALVGTPAPAAVMKTIDGKTIDLARSYGNKPVYIKFWATWCVPCRQQMPGFEKTYRELGDKVEVIAINIGLSDDEASVRKFRQKYGMTMPIVMDNDGQLAKLFHLGVTPQHVIIGKDVRFAYFGHAENRALEDALHRAIAGESTTAPALEVAGERVIKVGDMVPTLTATTMTGAAFPLGGTRPDRLRAVNFFSSWCEWYLEKTRPATAQACAKRREEIEALQGKHPNVDWIGISGGPWAMESDLADYKKNNTTTIALALDKSGALFRTFGIRDIPTIALIDSEGRLVRLVLPDETDLAGAIGVAQQE